MTESATSPAASGPAGSHFEGQVGAHYLLSMLTRAEPRGLPGTTIDRVEFQRAAEGRPLDDVIIHAHDRRGDAALLEIQVKRSITFAPADRIFRAVVGQIVKASRNPEFWSSRYELAIATARTSRKIDGAYQDVLTWARQLGSAETFIACIERVGSANDDMRTFVRTFRAHLRDAEAPHDDEAMWKLLRRLRILVFDFTAQGSASEELSKERAARALHGDEACRAADLWTTLIDITLSIASNGGDRTRVALVDELGSVRGFRLAGDPRSTSARAALAEASAAALADIGDRVGEVMITRFERVASVHAALDQGRYVEIRAAAGVGKSGVLKHFADQLAAESQVLVLSPGRTIAKGWTAMRATLGYDGTARELLSDLASDGGAALFIDGLDFFDRDDERRTVVDLVREAADVPGFSVVVTARLGFGIEEPSWLPTNALDRLGRAPPVVIGELSATELDQLRDADPRLAALLADDHPARNVARNLFRLARLASLPVGDPVPCTEADMAELWWKSADGKYDSGHRNRARVLKALAEQALLAGEPMDASYHPSQALDALVTSETLRDLGGDRVAFRHDVLREWAIASLLFAEPIRVDRLPLDRPAPASLDRAIELAARMALERSSDSTPWKSLLHTLSQDGAHGSWRRAALLAVVRSELGSEVLERVSDLLIADRGGLLRELIRTIMAVDVKPATELFAAAGIDVAFVPPSLHIPNKPSWPRLIEWALARHDQLPAKAIPDLVDFYIAWSYIAWSVAGMGLDPITPVLVTRLYTWLIEIEATGTLKTQEDQRKPFDSGLEYDGLRDLETNLRMGFLLFCHRVPQLAKKYLVHLRQSPKKRGVVGKFVKFSSDSLARAAPAELAELTVAALTPKIRSDRRCGDNQRCEPFEHLDREFLPASLAQGPFFNLLVHAPEHGLPLVRRLVDHAIEFYSDGSAPGSNAILIVFAQGERCFPWVQSYRWPRETAGLYSVTSALMALEAWAHRRVEAGDAFDTVLQDVLGPPGAPAAYLLIAVDLILSHWPRSREAALPFLGCPELLSLDRDRQMDDDFKVPDLFGLGLVEPKEPAGAASLEGLKKRPSRRFSLEQLMSHYAVFGPAEQREALTESLRRAAARLGNYDETATLADPAFMVVHALNLVNPVNWQEGRFEAEDGSTKIGRQYVSPSTESQHLAALQAESNPRLAETNLHAALGIALENEARSSPELAAAGVAWAQSPPVDGSEDAIWAREHSLVIAATLAMRDGDAELRATKEGWARGIFAEALRSEEDPVHRFRSGLKFNPIAIASVGMIHLLRDHAQPNDVRALLELAARQDPAMAHGFGASAATLAAIDERLPRAVLRCAFAARIQLWLDRETPEEQAAARTDDHRRRIQRTVEAELVWLSGEAPEPELPAFPVEPPCPRRRSFLTPAGIVESPQPTWDRTQPEHRVDHQGAALWLSKLAPLVDVSARPWIRDLVRTYGAWTARANGAGVNEDEEIGRVPDEWNNAYYNLLAYCLPGLSSEAIEKMAVEPICSLPEEAFFDVVSVFLRSVDAVFFENRGLETAEAVWIRSALGRRLIASNGWYRVGDYKSSSVERHIGPAIATFFMNDYAYFQPPRCYLLPKAVDRLDPFLVVLTELVESGRSLFIALVVLNLMEVSPRPGHLGFVVTAAKDWLTAYPDDTTFWVEHGIGRRVCAWIDVIREGHPATLDFTHGLRIDVDQLLAAFVRLGVPEARRLEESLATEA